MEFNDIRRPQLVQIQRRPEDSSNCFQNVQHKALRISGEDDGRDVVCFLYSREGLYYKVSKTVLLQTGFMRRILQSVEIFGLIDRELHLFFPEVESRLLKVVVTFLHYGILEASCEDQRLLFNILIKQFGFPTDMEFGSIRFDSDDYDDLHSKGINVEECEICRAELKLRQLYPHVQTHVDDEIGKIKGLISESRHVTCCFCKDSNGINYIGEADEVQYVVDHLEGHLANIARRLQVRYCFRVKKGPKLKPVKKVNGLQGDLRSKVQIQDLQLNKEPEQSTSGYKKDNSSKTAASDPDLNKLECQKCPNVVSVDQTLRHVVDHNIDFWQNFKPKRNSSKMLTCQFQKHCPFYTSSRKELIYHIALDHQDAQNMMEKREIDVKNFFKSVTDIEDLSDSDKYMEHVSDEETDVEEH